MVNEWTKDQLDNVGGCALKWEASGRSRLKSLCESVCSLVDQLTACRKERDGQKAEVKRLREGEVCMEQVLRFYSKERNYERQPEKTSLGDTTIMFDGGRQARGLINKRANERRNVNDTAATATD